jgi:AcrR family transcriptional regulator
MVATPLPDTRSTREAILDAAERQFGDRGFNGVSVREVVADAGLKNQASLYDHFPGKQALYEAVLARGINAMVERLAPGAGDDGTASLDAMLDYLVGHQHLARLIHRAGLESDPLVREAVPRLIRPLYEHGLRVLQQTGGPWKADQLPHLAAGLYNLIFGYFAMAEMLRIALEDDPESPSALARQRAFLHAAVGRLLGAE